MGVTHKIGAQYLRAAYGHNRDIKLNGGSAPETKAGYVAVGYGYKLSKRTDVYATYAKLDNAARSRNDFIVSGVGGVTNGTDLSGLSLGIVHIF